MSGKGSCYDNAAMETFFKTIALIECTHSIVAQRKVELVWRNSRQTRRAVEAVIFEYINGFYPPRSRHPALGWKSPVACERKVA